MTKADYLEILMRGYYDHANFLARHITMQQKVAEEKGIQKDEFFDGLRSTFKRVIDKRHLKYLLSFNDFHCNRHNTKCTIEPTEQDVIIDLSEFTNGKYNNDLAFNDIESISNAIEDAYNRTLEPSTGSSTLQVLLTIEQIKKLHKILITQYIENISEVDFIYWLTGKQLFNNVPKIKWEKKQSKGKAIQLFKAICLNFSYTSLNKCVETNSKKFDSNDVSKTGYAEIDQVVIQVTK